MRILILGATGMLGHKLCQQLGQRFPDVNATLRGRVADFPHIEHLGKTQVIGGIDALDFACVRHVLERVRPNVVINCVAVTKRRAAADDTLASIELNAALPHRLGAWTATHDTRLIHFSTDCVFDGRAGGYTEESPTNAEDLYGRTKALGEVTGTGILTLRTSFIGREISHGTELLEWFLGQGGKRIKGYRNALYTGVSTLWMAKLVGDLVERYPRLEGLYQVAAPQISKYELLLLARQAFAVPVEIDADDHAGVRRNLDGKRFRETTGIEVPDWRSMMSDLARDPTPYARWSMHDAA